MKAADKLTLESVLLVIDVIHDGGKQRRLDFPHLRSGVLLARDLVESAETAPESGIEVVFDVIVSAAWGREYRPVKCLEMSFQRLPCNLWSWKRRSSS